MTEREKILSISLTTRDYPDDEQHFPPSRSPKTTHGRFRVIDYQIRYRNIRTRLKSRIPNRFGSPFKPILSTSVRCYCHLAAASWRLPHDKVWNACGFSISFRGVTARELPWVHIKYYLQQLANISQVCCSKLSNVHGVKSVGSFCEEKTTLVCQEVHGNGKIHVTRNLISVAVFWMGEKWASNLTRFVSRSCSYHFKIGSIYLTIQS